MRQGRYRRAGCVLAALLVLWASADLALHGTCAFHPPLGSCGSGDLVIQASCDHAHDGGAVHTHHCFCHTVSLAQPGTGGGAPAATWELLNDARDARPRTAAARLDHPPQLAV